MPGLNLLLLLSSLFLNIFFLSRTRPELGWSQQAAEEAEAVAAMDCSGHGRAFLDSLVVDGFPTCECNACHGGRDCSEMIPDCIADVDSGDPLFLEPFWKKHAQRSAVVVSGWHRMSYEANGDNLISLELEKHIRLLHKAVGNAVANDKFIVFGAGATQLLNAAVHAFSRDDSSSPSSVVASVPYYPVYKAQTQFFDSTKYEWKGSTSDWVNSNRSSNKHFIEIVASPNNPDGQPKESVLGGSSAIHDHAYYWPHFSAIPAPVDEDVMIFSNSKISGHASSRFGWMLIKDEKVYNKVVTYMTLNTYGVSSDTQLRVLKLIKVMLSEIGGQEDLFKSGYSILRERWHKLNKLISSSKRFSLQQLSRQYCTYFHKIRDPSPAFGWLRCEMEDDKDCKAVLRDAGIISRGGADFGADSRYTRLSLIKTDDDFDLLMVKMEALISKEGHSSM